MPNVTLRLFKINAYGLLVRGGAKIDRKWFTRKEFVEFKKGFKNIEEPNDELLMYTGTPTIVPADEVEEDVNIPTFGHETMMVNVSQEYWTQILVPNEMIYFKKAHSAGHEMLCNIITDFYRTPGL